ncbi:hypothetical protein [Sharpea porci]|nr:hypothetical protein [Sharpea porci]
MDIGKIVLKGGKLLNGKSLILYVGVELLSLMIKKYKCEMK